LFKEFTGKEEDVIREEIDRDNFMSPAQAVEFGILDAVLE
jgi:ATP-dependent Clp protease protease subunit